MPRIAIIIPCYKQAQYLSECISSVLRQTLSDWVAVVVDDGSPDNTAEVVRQFSLRDSRITYLHQENQGLAAARNTGIRGCASQYILPLDADDYIAPTYLSKTLPVLEENPNIKVVYTRCRYFGSADEEMQIRSYSFKQLLSGNIFPATALYRRSDYVRTQGYDPALVDGWEDWDFWLSLLGPQDQVYQVDEVLFFYRRKAESMITRMEDEQKRAATRRRIFLNHKESYNEYFDDPLNLYNCIRRLEKENRALRRKDIMGRLLRLVQRITGRQN